MWEPWRPGEGAQSFAGERRLRVGGLRHATIGHFSLRHGNRELRSPTTSQLAMQ